MACYRRFPGPVVGLRDPGFQVRYDEFLGFSQDFAVLFQGGTGGQGVVDSDGDGLADDVEQRGWTVTVVRADGTIFQRDVSSDPFRKDTDGRWLWPGFGENSRVLKYIFERCAGIHFGHR